MMNADKYKLKKIWDLPTRAWHWLLVIAFTGNFFIGKFMSFETIIWHFYIGYFIIGLMFIRIVRGFIGPAPIRFKALLFSLSDTFNYIRVIHKKKPSGVSGHNPIGALSVIAMILLISAQAISGLFLESDDFFEYGPLSGLVPENIVGWMTWWHHTFADVLIILIGLHVLAIIFYLVWKKENLIKPMFNGMKLVKSKIKSPNQRKRVL